MPSRDWSLDGQEITKSQDRVTLSSIHQAKGLEWANVAYLDYDKVWDGAQESNIKYVGVTRAQDTLTLQMKES